MTRIALIWFVYQSTGSPQAVGWLLLCYTGPVVFGGWFAGSLLDRFDRRMVMLSDNTFRGAVVALIPLLYFSVISRSGTSTWSLVSTAAS